MHLTVILSTKRCLLPAMPTSVQGCTTSSAASTRANVEAAACAMLWHTMLMSVASTASSLTSDLMFLTVVSKISIMEYLLEVCKTLQISITPQNIRVGFFFLETRVVPWCNDVLGENGNSLYIRYLSQCP